LFSFSTFFGSTVLGLGVDPSGLFKGFVDNFGTGPLLSKKLFMSDILLLITAGFLGDYPEEEICDEAILS
jgi:hypothetical protein